MDNINLIKYHLNDNFQPKFQLNLTDSNAQCFKRGVATDFSQSHFIYAFQ